MSARVWRPILAGMWKQHEAEDGTYDVIDLIEVNRALDVHYENQRRYSAAVAASQRT